MKTDTPTPAPETAELLPCPSTDDPIATMISDLSHTGELSMLYRMEIADAVTALRAEVATLRASEARMREALVEIARQKKTDELETEHDAEVADFEGGYDACIDRARAALQGEQQ